MSLFLAVKTAQLDARREKNGVAASILTTLIGEAETASKKIRAEGHPTDNEMIAIIKKFISNIDDLLSHSPGNFNAILEKSILVRFLPKQMSEVEIRNIIEEQNFNFKDKKALPIIMQFFKQKYEGLYDGRLLSVIVKEKQNAAE